MLAYLNLLVNVVLNAVNVLLNAECCVRNVGQAVPLLMGYFVGHLYYFLKESYPSTRDHLIFFAPLFLQVLNLTRSRVST